MAEVDCTEFAASIAKLALRLAESYPSIRNLDGVVAKIQERLPVTREIVADAVVAFTSEERAEQTNDLKRQLAEIKREARDDTKLRTRIEALEQEIASGQVDPDSPKVKRAVSQAITELRKKRDRLRTEAEIRRDIREVEGKIVAKDLSVQKRSPKINDAALQELRDQRRALRQKLSGMRQSSRQAQALRDQIADLDQQITTGQLAEPQPRKPDEVTEEVAGLRTERDRKRTERDLRRSIQGKGQQVSSGTIAPAQQRAPRFDDAQMRELRDERDELNKQIAAARAEPQKVARLQEQVSALEGQIASGQIAEREARPAAAVSPEVQALRDRRAELQRESQLRQQIDSMLQQLDTNEIILPQVRTPKAVSNQVDRLLVDRQRLRQLVNRRINAMRPWTWRRALWTSLSEPANVTRSLLASTDLSAALIQAGFRTISRPIQTAKNVWPSIQVLTSESRAMALDQEIRTRPNAALYAQGKLGLSETGTDARLTRQEEVFMSDLVRRIPVLGQIVKASERSFVTFLNLTRADMFDALLAGTARDGNAPTLDEIRAVGTAVNMFTGRGPLGKMGEQAAPLLNTVFFAPRLTASSFQIAAGAPLYDGTARTRKAVAAEYARFFTGFSALIAAAAFAGADIEWDPRSSDFLKIRFGDTRIPVGARIFQPIVLVSKLFLGEVKSPTTGRTTAIRGPDKTFAGSSGDSVLGTFLKNKLSPGARLAVDLWNGENFDRNPVNVTSIEGIVNIGKGQLVPISVQEMFEAFEKHNVPKAAMFTIINLFGAGISTYGADPLKAIDNATAPRADRNPGESREAFEKRRREREEDRERALDALRDSSLTKDEMRAVLKEQFKKRGGATRMVGKNGQPTSYAKRLRQINALD